MKQEELKLLAEWYGYKYLRVGYWGEKGEDGESMLQTKLGEDFIDRVLGIEDIGFYYVDVKGKKFMNYESWHPDLDSNQLDMLEDKMIEEIQKGGKHWFIIIPHETEYTVNHQLSSGQTNSIKCTALGKGKTKNEARLSAIINYIKGLKDG